MMLISQLQRPATSMACAIFGISLADAVDALSIYLNIS